jgi:DNA-binding response OmpR family regulator
MKLLLVEDSERLRRALGLALKRAGYAVDASGDGSEGLWLAENNCYDAIILDLMLPSLDGLSILERLRARGNPTHVLLLTARDAVEDRVRGLRAGADDYLPKPFALDELLARVEALCRRAYGVKQSRIVIGPIEIETAAKVVRREGELIALAPREYALLEYLAMRRGEVVTRTEIEAHLYDSNSVLMSNTVDSAICALRRKIQPLGSPTILATRRGQGYVFDAS